MKNRQLTVAIAVAVFIFFLFGNAGTLTAHVVERVSVSDSAEEGNEKSDLADVSADGKFVVFASYATNLVPAGTGIKDIFVYNLQTHTIEKISVNDSGESANSHSHSDNIDPDNPRISADGHYVAFNSYATNLVAGDNNNRVDVFRYNLWDKTIRRASVDNTGGEGNDHSMDPSISGNGQLVAFDSMADNLVGGDTNMWSDVFVYDCQSDTIERVSENASNEIGNSASRFPDISGNGLFVAFVSWSTNLVPGDTNGEEDIFVKNRVTKAVKRVSIGSLGEADDSSYNPSISADGQFVTFFSYATNLVAGDTNGIPDIFLYDTIADTIERISVGPGGIQSNGSSYSPYISADGNYVTFASYAENLVTDDSNLVSDIFVYDTTAKTTQRISKDSLDNEGNNGSGWPSISADGKVVAFHSQATNLVPGDTNSKCDVFAVCCHLESCTPTFTCTNSPTPTFTPTATISATITQTSTISPTPTISPTVSPTPTVTQTLTHSVTHSITPTTPPTPTATPTVTFTFTPTPEDEEIVVYPNPFDPDEAFGGTLKFKGLPEDARVTIYTVSGELVRELMEDVGAAYWDARTKDGGLVSMGSYVYVIRVGKETIKRGKVVVIR